jgi:hypothetical protein
MFTSSIPGEEFMATDNKKKSAFGSLQITDRESCAKAIRNGGIAALISAAITGAFAVVGMFAQTTNKELAYFLDPWLLVDVALLVVFAIFVFRKSRIAATLLFVYFVASKALVWIELGEPKGLFVSIIFFAYYLTAMRGTYLWHSKYANVPTAAAAA